MIYLMTFALALAVGALVFVGTRLIEAHQTGRELKDELDRYQQERSGHAGKLSELTSRIEKLNRQVALQKARINQLARWSRAADAETESQHLLARANESLNEAKVQSASLRLEAERQVAELIAQANQRSATLTAEAQSTFDHAKALAESLAADAVKALEQARNEADEVTRGAQLRLRAIENQISGYGEEYILPVRSLLDDLADEFGHKDAGRELKLARERTTKLIRAGLAATCEYVEPQRRDTAIRFVIDAFNGKVDSVLSRVRHDNVGKLRQEIVDAFVIVNANGAAFRNARITEDFLVARQDELKWAAIAQQLKLDEKDEQRRIKEQIREEEKARRELDRAIRESARDEERLRKAIEQKERELSEASAAQRAEFEKQLAELTGRLKDAESRNQRAISMAQQTKCGHVYVISNIGSFGDDVFKIGMTRRLEPLDRVRELGDSSVPFGFDVHALIYSEDAPALEHSLHKHFVAMQVNKVNHRKEFFRVPLSQIKEEIETLGMTPHWTMLAEAREYRETLAIERTISTSAESREAWIRQQIELEDRADNIEDFEGETDIPQDDE